MKKYMSISELEAGEMVQPIWALNGLAESTVGVPGDVIVGIPKLNGSKVDPLAVPQTWLPICLTDQIPRAQLLASAEFRSAVNKKLIMPIETPFAQSMLEMEGATEELQRLADQQRAVREATSSRGIQSGTAEIISTSELNDRVRDEAEQVDPNAMDASFVMFTDSMGSKTDIEAMNAVRGRGKFKSSELRHLLKELRDKPKTLQYIQGLLK